MDRPEVVGRQRTGVLDGPGCRHVEPVDEHHRDVAQLLTALVEEAVSVGALVRLLQFQGGSAHLVEVTLADDSPAASVAIADLGMPRDASLVAAVRDDRLVVPRGDTVLQARDEVLVLVTADAEQAVRSLLRGT
jgi:trk system potassium uptake protein TrkA